MEIIKEKDMKLLSRKRVILTIEGKATPARHELVKDIAKKCGVKEDQIVIKHIYPQFGGSTSKVIVHVYQDNGKVKVFEHANLLKKHEKPVKQEKVE